MQNVVIVVVAAVAVAVAVEVLGEAAAAAATAASDVVVEEGCGGAVTWAGAWAYVRVRSTVCRPLCQPWRWARPPGPMCHPVSGKPVRVRDVWTTSVFSTAAHRHGSRARQLENPTSPVHTLRVCRGHGDL